ncbi:unnamed protein product [Effrenium voratum]|nr:unnamed protein product [Effrenium voratum]
MAKGKDAKGAGKGQPENYKTELCRFFQQGCCGKGSTCPFAHGEHELRGDAVQKDNSRMKDADVMCWLQARRQQGGKAGEEFERQWKAWCKANQLSEVSKAERVNSIYAFREAQEGTPDETTSTTSQKPEKPAKTKKPKFNKSPKCPQGHLMSDLLCAEGDEYECDGCSREVKSGRFYDCRDCDYSLCVTCGRETDSKDEDPTAPGPAAEADTAEGAEGAERAWKAGVRTLQEKLWAAVPLRLTLPDDLTLSDEVMSAIRQRCAVQAGGVFSSSQQCLVNTCLGEQNLAAVSNTLRLRRWLQQPLSCQEEHSRATLCLLQALWGGSPGQREAAEAVIDFVVIVGLSHFIALGVTASVTSGDSDDEGDEAAAPEEHQEPEEAARGRRVEAQQEKTSTRRWDYTGGYRPAEKESNEEAM